MTKIILSTNFFKDISGKIYLGFSGGLDSSVLLHLCATQLDKLTKEKLHILHVNHGLSENAFQWAEHCQKVSEQYQLPITIIKVNGKAEQGESPEAAARNARYQSFKDLIKQGDALLTAHHQDDQVETFFLQLFRGAGVNGLAGMPTEKAFYEGVLLRPLLNYSRQQLEACAKDFQLTWIEDESNFDTNLQRNFLRQEVLPLIQSQWPGLNTTILRSQSLCQEALELNQEIAKQDLSDITRSEATKQYKETQLVNSSRLRRCARNDINKLSIKKLSQLAKPRALNLLRFWITKNNFQLPSQAKLLEVYTTVLNAKEDAMPLVQWCDTEVRRYKDELYIMPQLKVFDSSLVLAWDGKSQLELPNDLGFINSSIFKKLNLPKATEATKITIRFRQGGEKIKLPNKSHHTLLKHYFQESNVPPWLRDRTPLLYFNEELVAVLYSV